jgi:5S rRNA maturation endonuclease (ribonuclease M5)
MTKRVLMIVESPNKAKKIRGFFPAFNLMATVGHFKDLPRDTMGVEPPMHQPEYVVSEGKQSFITKLRAAAKDAEVIYVATDPDREGEAIAAHVVNTLGKSHSSKISRITYTEITHKAIEQAIQAKRSVDWSLVSAQAPVSEKTEAQKKPKTQPNVTPGELCPACGKGRLSVRKLGSGERAGREFIGCSVFPTCRFFQWMH